VSSRERELVKVSKKKKSTKVPRGREKDARHVKETGLNSGAKV